MKLSELVEGWPEKKEVEFMDLIPDIRFKDGHNACREACDKEVMVDEDEIFKQVFVGKNKAYEGDCPQLEINHSVCWECLAIEISKAIAQNIKGILKEVKK